MRTLTTCLILLSATLCAQQATLDFSARRALDAEPSRETVRIFIKGDVQGLRGDWSRYEAVQRSHSGDIASIEIPRDRIAELAVDPRVLRIELPSRSGQLLSDRVLVNNNIWQIHEGLGTLQQPLDGEDVVIGYLDSGIDFLHPDFRNEDGTTRIKWLWDQNLSFSSKTPSYGYGREYDNVAIDAGQCPHLDPAGSNGHGTNVVGIGSSNGLAMNMFQGAAPKSDIIVVAIDFSQDFLSHVADAIEYCFDKADQLGKPCVVNTSVGQYGGSHDGLDLTTQFIENLIEEERGRMVVAAGGNAGQFAFHVGYDVTTDTCFTWFAYYPAATKVLFEFWADEADLNNVHFGFGAYNSSTNTDLGQTAFINVIADLDLDVNTTATYNETVAGAGIVDLYAAKSEGRYNVQVTISPFSSTTWWSLKTTGSGHIDLWSHSSLTGTSDIQTTGLPSIAQYPNIIYYKPPDLEQQIVSSWQCSDKVLTVANYNNRVKYLNFTGTITTITTEINLDIANTSSAGPSRTGLTKPDLAATGNTILSAAPKYISDAWKGSNPTVLAPGGLHKRNGGTSMASPVVAGVAAMMLQRDPNLSYRTIKDAIVMSARADSFTGSVPNDRWGYGKLDAFAALSVPLGCTDPVAENYDPFAQVDDSTCTYLRLGIDDPTALTYLAVRPNPVRSVAEVAYKLPSYGAQLLLHDLSGKVVAQFELQKREGIAQLPVQSLDAGVYVLGIVQGQSMLASEKVVIIR